jgi:hypothetical protein
MRQLGSIEDALWRRVVVESRRSPRVLGYFEDNLVDSDQVLEQVFTDELVTDACALPGFVKREEAAGEITRIEHDLIRLTEKDIRIPWSWWLLLGALPGLVIAAVFVSDIAEVIGIAAAMVCVGSTGLLLRPVLPPEKQKIYDEWIENGWELIVFISFFVGIFLWAAIDAILGDRAWLLMIILAIILSWKADDANSDPRRAKIIIFRQFWFMYLIPGLDVPYWRAADVEREWLDDAAEQVILPALIQTINVLLGDDSGKLLSKQDSVGLKRLHEPDLLVSTMSEARVREALGRTDGGSIAIAGPRGAGKSTLLRALTRGDDGQLALLVSAPAGYIPKEFLTDLFQRICEVYLLRNGVQIVPRFGGRIRERRRHLFRTLWPTFRLVLAVASLVVLVWSLYTDLLPRAQRLYISTQQQIDQITTLARSLWEENRVGGQVALFIIFLFLMPASWIRETRKRRHEPELIRAARDTLDRLSVERTATWGINAGISGLAAASLSRGSADKLLPWVMPELVGKLRTFLQEIAQQEKQPIMIGIDEVDRIGSIDQAERFISEVKAIFGIENCFFLMSVAEDVGSLFARRAIAGRSVFENAFDEIISLESLTLAEAQALLQRRVLGLTAPFVYLAYILSGGLPRELIRVTRRLIEINEETGYALRLSELTNLLVSEELRAAIGGTRSQLGSLSLDTNWGPTFDRLLTIETSLATDIDAVSLVSTLSELAAFEIADLPTNAPSDTFARRTVMDLTAYAYFGLNVVHAFANFNIAVVRVAPARSSGSYERLAAARRELSISPQSSREILIRFQIATSITGDANP